MRRQWSLYAAIRPLLVSRHLSSSLPPNSSWSPCVPSVWDGLGPGTWDLLLQRLHLDKHLSKQQNTKKFEGTKNKYTTVQLGQIINSKTQKITNPIATIEVSEQKQEPVHDPAHSTTKGVGRPPKPPLWPDPSPHIRDQLSLPSSGSKQGNLFLVFTPDGCSLSPNKDLSKFLL